MTGISANMPSFGKPLPMRAPNPPFALLQPEVVGEMVVDAILRNRFMVQTHPEVGELLIARAGDWDGFIQHQIDNPNIIAQPAAPNLEH